MNANVCKQIDAMIDDEKQGIKEYGVLIENMDKLKFSSKKLEKIREDEKSHLATLLDLKDIVCR